MSEIVRDEYWSEEQKEAIEFWLSIEFEEEFRQKKTNDNYKQQEETFLD